VALLEETLLDMQLFFRVGGSIIFFHDDDDDEGKVMRYGKTHLTLLRPIMTIQQ
jgi:hypothetical protein